MRGMLGGVTAALLYCGAVPGGAFAQQIAGLDEQKYPNIVAPDRQFGSYGFDPGQLIDPLSIAIGPDNNIYIADTGNHRIQVFAGDGAHLKTWGKPGTLKGEYRYPEGIAVSSKGSVCVADTGNNRIQILDQTGAVIREWGEFGKDPGQLNHPVRLCAAKEELYVVDSGNSRIQVFGVDGRLIRCFGKEGKGAGEFVEPTDVAVDEDGNVYVADSGNNRIQKFDPSGFPVKAWGKWGSHAGLFATPHAVAYSRGHIFVADLVNHRTQVFDKEGEFVYQWGRHPSTAHEGNGRMHYPTSIAVAPSGDFTVVCESFENRCQIFARKSLGSVKQVNDSAWWDKATRFHYGTKTKQASAAFVLPPSQSGGVKAPVLLAIVEQDTHSVLFFDNASGNPALITKIGGFGTGLGQFNMPAGLAINSNRQVFVSDRGNHRIQLLQLNPDPSTPSGLSTAVMVVSAFDLTQLVNPPPPGYNPALADPGALSLDVQGNLYVVDGLHATVLVFNPAMQLVRFFQLPHESPRKPERWVDGMLTPDGKRFYVVDKYNFRILVFDALNGHLEDRFGTPGAFHDHDFLSPFGILIDPDGFVYLTDQCLNCVKKFNKKGEFVKQWGHFGTQNGEFYKPKGLTFAAPGQVLVVDFGNHRGQIFTTNGDFVALFGLGEISTQ